ncbi:MAG: PilT/PilU family type 4a pilus ATPase [Candidatus Hydrogenedentota bacterium]
MADSISVEIRNLLQIMVEQDASDLHLRVGSPPYFRIRTEIYQTDSAKLTQEDLWRFVKEILNEKQLERFNKGEEVDLSIGIHDFGRFRTNVFFNRGSPGIVVRKINLKIPTLEELQLPQAIGRIADIRQGLVCVVGPTGCGKSTTLAALIHRINQSRRCHIVTIEDPIEFLHKNINSIVTQREIGTDCSDFSTALKFALRQDPDVILVGELRDVETIRTGMQAAETGHLVLTTLHTNNAAQTIERIIEFFPHEQHQFVKIQLTLFLKAVVAQKIVPRADGSGLIATCEIMFMSPVVQKLIFENKIKMIKSIIHHSVNEGMQTFDQDLVSLVNDGIVKFEDARVTSEIPDSFHMAMKGFFSDIASSVFE